MKWLIQHNTARDEVGYPLYWSNDTGYGDLHNATWFEDEIRRVVSLPVNGHWVEVKTPVDYMPKEEET